MSIFPLKPTSSYIRAYFAALAQFQKHGHLTEGNTRSAFADLLKRCCGPYGWHLVEEFNFRGTKKQSLRADGALVDELTLNHGIWEAKDTADDLKIEIKKKVDKGYPLVNTLFQSPDYAILYQDSRIAFDKPLDTAENVVEVLQLFFDHQIVPGVDWQKVIKEFSLKIPEIAAGILILLDEEHESNAKFREQFASFAELCRSSINPDLSDKSICTMLVQHLLTERVFRKVFNNQEFLQRNVIAVEIEKVIGSITAKHFSRDLFLKPLDHFYIPLERAAEQQEDYTEKQHFLNAVYERFFQSFDPKQADTMGIVYTPQPIVDFMVRSVEEILEQEFGKSLSDEGVHILDPFTGTGNFITRIMQEIKRSALPHKYAHELHCNEIMLLPYYIASMNIEHAYMEKVKQYSPFEGICLVDTFELSEFGQQSFAFSDSNTERVRKQKKQPIFVVIGNPPYNMGQVNENDGNKNRRYKHWENRVRETYTKSSAATLRNKLSDPYVKAFRWASDRIRQGGMIAYVTNNSFLDNDAFDGMRYHLYRDFTSIVHFDLKGDARTSGERRQREGGNIFDDKIRVGVGVTFLIKNPTATSKTLRIFRIPDRLRSRDKTALVQSLASVSKVAFEEVVPDLKHNWLLEGRQLDYEEFLPTFVKGSISVSRSLFLSFLLGVNTARDMTAYSNTRKVLQAQIRRFAIAYAEFGQSMTGELPSVKTLKVSRNLVDHAKRKDKFASNQNAIVQALYRPFYKRWLGLQDILVDEPGIGWSAFAPGQINTAICWNLRSKGAKYCLATNVAPDYHLVGDTGCFPFFAVNKSGEQRENITNWALNEFRKHYHDDSITKWDIFHSTYAILQHSEYRIRYAANLKRELPRIPFPPDFHSFAAAGKRLMQLHIDYEQQPEYKLEQVEDPDADITYQVTKMKLLKDKTELRYNDFLTLRNIPAGVHDYRLGNRSALEWVIDQYQVSTDKRSGIVNDPNREDDPKYILRLIGQVITVSLETNSIIAALPTLGLPEK